MNRMMMAVVAAISALTAAAGERLPARFGDVTLQGPVGDRLERMIRNHVTAKDPVYLAECFKNRSEDFWWQTEFWGKYMHGAVPLWELTKCPVLKAKIDASTAAVIAAQDEEGYIGNYTPEKRFAPGSWDVWGCKYVLMGLIHHFDATGDKRDLAAALRLCRYVAKKVGPGAAVTIARTGNYAGLPSCSILEPVVWLYRRTKEADVLAFADFIVREMTEAADGPRLLDLAEAGVPVAERSKLPKDATSVWDGLATNRGKAYEMMSCYQGILDYVEVMREQGTGNRDQGSGIRDWVERLYRAAVLTAENIIAEEINLAGGAASYEHWYHGAKHQHECFPHTQETCVTITWMRLCEKLLALTGDVKYADEFEKTFYNAYLAALDRDCDEFAAYTPLSGTRSRGHIHCHMHTNCCNENGPRGFIAFLRSLLQAQGDTVFLNHYASSRAKIAVPATGDVAEFEIHTLYPKTGSVEIYARHAKPTAFKLALRIPGWAAGVKMTVNGEDVDAKELAAGTWCVRERTWKDGDTVLIDFELPVRRHDLGTAVAFTRGPVLLARDTRFADGDLSEPLRHGVRKLDANAAFRAVRTPDPAMAMAFEAELPFGLHDENPDGRLAASVRFCDYASAANEWSSMNACRTWFEVERDPAEVLPKED